MKFKESNSKISLAKICKVFFICTAASFVLRTLQMYLFIDHQTGFFTGGTAVNYIAFAVIFLAAAGIMICSYLSAQSAKMDVYAGKNTLTGVTSVLFAVALFYDSGASVAAAFTSEGTSYAGSAFQSLMLSGTLPLLLRGVFALLSFVYFLMFSLSAFKGNTGISKHKYLAVAPVGWAGFRMIHRFIEQISFIRVSELFLELILLAFMILFFMAFAQIASGVYRNDFKWRLMGVGLPAALIAFTLNGARLIFTLTQGSAAINADYGFCLCDFVFFLFVSAVVVSAVKQTEKNTAAV